MSRNGATAIATTATKPPPARRKPTPAPADDFDAHELSKLLDLIRSEARIAILRALAESGELCVGEIQERLGKAQRIVSFHLGLLRASGLVEGRRGPQDGRRVYYRVLPDRIRRLQRLIGGLVPESRGGWTA